MQTRAFRFLSSTSCVDWGTAVLNNVPNPRPRKR